MKRPKIADMTPLEHARFTILSCRRLARRVLRRSARIRDSEALSPTERATSDRHYTEARTTNALTKPSWVARATLEELYSAMAHLSGESH
jgi:hypothetical protein